MQQSRRVLVVSAVALIVLGSVGVLAQEPKPEFYGIYALDDGKLKDLYKNADLNDFSSGVRFVLFSRDLRTVGPLVKLFFIPPPKRPDPRAGEFRGWDDFFKQSQNFTKEMETRLMYDVGSDAVDIPFRVGPYGGSDEMVRVVPSRELPPGLYQLDKGVRFWISRREVAEIYKATAAPAAERADSPVNSNATPAPLYPISSGTNRQTRVEFTRNPLIFRDVSLYLNGSDQPIKMGARTVEKLELEVGSRHSLRAVVGRQTFEAILTVPNFSLVEIQINANGIVGRGVTPK
jgi:hypothetical protein